MTSSEKISEMARLSLLCSRALLAVDFDPEAYQPAPDSSSHVLAELAGGGGRFSEIRRRMALGFYAEAKITEKILDKLADDLHKDSEETN